MKVVQLHELTPKHLMNPAPTPKIAHEGPKKSKITPKLCNNQISKLTESYKMKALQLHD